MRGVVIATICAIALLSACTVESAFVDMIQEKIRVDLDDDSISKSYRDMVAVPGGTYTQSEGTESFAHTVSGFRIGQYEVTYELWYTVHRWALSNGYTLSNPGREGHDGTLTTPGGAEPTAARYEPVTTMNWRDAIVWCNAYSEMSGLEPVYCSDSAMLSPLKISNTSGPIDATAGSVDYPFVNWSANGYRLPTEGEWQYAASYRDGISWTSPGCASGVPDPDFITGEEFVAWYSGNSGSTTHVVGTRKANQLGIHDMSGNVYEWCWDWYGDYPAGPESDYIGLSSGNFRVPRGQSWRSARCRVGGRGASSPAWKDFDIGMRVAQRL